MTDNQFSNRINDLLEAENWGEARRLLEKELLEDGESHWLLTQIGVTYYEQRQYKVALKYFIKSFKIVRSCPLTLWNLAGTLDALGKSKEAVRIFQWLLSSNNTSDEDPCWEDKDWTNSLKTDCVYRLGLCFQHLDKTSKAAGCFREYVTLLLNGYKGSYPINEVLDRLTKMKLSSTTVEAKKEFRKAVQSTLLISGSDRGTNHSNGTLTLHKIGLPTGRRVASKQ